MTSDQPIPEPPAASGAPPSWEALARELAGEASDDASASAAVRAWLAAHPRDAALLDALARLDVPPVGVADAPRVDVEAALAGVRRRIAAEPVDARPVGRDAARARPVAPPVARSAWRRDRRLVPLAAAATLLLAAGAAFWSRGGGEGRPGPAAADTAPAAVVAAGAARTFATPVGRRDSLRLPDGTRVVLAPGSALEVAAGYGGARRDVTLRGAAYFVVRHDAARPFVVRAGAALVRDVGTAFVVRSDAGASGRGVAVSVTEGVVALARAATATAGATAEEELRAGDSGALAPDGTVQLARGGATPDDLAWTQGRLVYRAAPVAEVQADLRRWYGVELRLEGPGLAGRHLTLTIADEPVDEVLRAIALALGGTLERRGDVAVVRSARPAPPARGAASDARRRPLLPVPAGTGRAA